MKGSFFGRIFGSGKSQNKHDESRPVVAVKEGPNVWRIVYADEAEYYENAFRQKNMESRAD